LQIGFHQYKSIIQYYVFAFSSTVITILKQAYS